MTDRDGLPTCLQRTGRFMLCKLPVTSILVAEIFQTCGHTRVNLNTSTQLKSASLSCCAPDAAKAKPFQPSA